MPRRPRPPFPFADKDNPLPLFIDPITMSAVVRPAISPYGYVAGLATWKVGEEGMQGARKGTNEEGVSWIHSRRVHTAAAAWSAKQRWLGLWRWADGLPRVLERGGCELVPTALKGLAVACANPSP